MDCRDLRVLRALSRVKELAEKGKIYEAKKEMIRIDNILKEKERNAMIKIFARSLAESNKEIEWNDICHS